MNATQKIPADQFLDEAIRALTFADLAELKRLEMVSPKVASPIDAARYWTQRAVFAALLDASGRNLRLFHRAARKQAEQHVKPAVR